MSVCPKCGDEFERDLGNGYCCSCHAKYMRENRPKYGEMSELQKKKDNCRSYAGVYFRRGKIEQASCEHCGNEDSQMHHEDYDKPLEVNWLCRPCHLQLHAD